MDVQNFMALFEKELETNSRLHAYYRFHSDRKRYWFRKAYFEQRLEYIAGQTKGTGLQIWDAGCGFATSAIYLALNGHQVYGDTLEYYSGGIGERLAYWGQHGDLRQLEVKHENIFHHAHSGQTYDVILVQDTLHHLEPVQEALDLFYLMLRPGGRLVVVEENGDSLFIRAKNMRIRGFKRKGMYHDGLTGTSVPFGNENARGRKAWFRLLASAGFDTKNPDLEFIRILPPFLFNEKNHADRMQWERKIGRDCRVIRKFFYFGMNFTVTRPSE